jgi:hypothetical protein
MPTKKTEAGREYQVTDKKFIWSPEDDAGEVGNLPQVEIPLRIKLKVIRALADRDLDDAAAMFDLLEAIVPGQADVLDEMDMNDFVDMFGTWQNEYTALNGASLPESSGSSS